MNRMGEGSDTNFCKKLSQLPLCVSSITSHLHVDVEVSSLLHD